MPIVSVSVPHPHDPDAVKERTQPYIEKMVDDFEGHDLDLEWDGYKADFTFKSLAFKITGTAVIDSDNITINVDLPVMAMIFKDKVEQAITKNLTRAVESAEEDSEGESPPESDR